MLIVELQLGVPGCIWWTLATMTSHHEHPWTRLMVATNGLKVKPILKGCPLMVQTLAWGSIQSSSLTGDVFFGFAIVLKHFRLLDGSTVCMITWTHFLAQSLEYLECCNPETSLPDRFVVPCTPGRENGRRLVYARVVLVHLEFSQPCDVRITCRGWGCGISGFPKLRWSEAVKKHGENAA